MAQGVEIIVSRVTPSSLFRKGKNGNSVAVVVEDLKVVGLRGTRGDPFLNGQVRLCPHIGRQTKQNIVRMNIPKGPVDEHLNARVKEITVAKTASVVADAKILVA